MGRTFPRSSLARAFLKSWAHFIYFFWQSSRAERRAGQANRTKRRYAPRGRHNRTFISNPIDPLCGVAQPDRAPCFRHCGILERSTSGWGGRGFKSRRRIFATGRQVHWTLAQMGHLAPATASGTRQRGEGRQEHYPSRLTVRGSALIFPACCGVSLRRVLGAAPLPASSNLPGRCWWPRRGLDLSGSTKSNMMAIGCSLSKTRTA
jgi:hypothetical protein